MARIAGRAYRVGDPLPPVGKSCLVAGSNTDISCDQDRAYTFALVIGYTPDGKFACFQKEGCWPFVERMENLWFGEIE